LIDVDAKRVFKSCDAAAIAGCSRTMTFDRGAAKSCGMQLLG